MPLVGLFVLAQRKTTNLPTRTLNLEHFTAGHVVITHGEKSNALTVAKRSNYHPVGYLYTIQVMEYCAVSGVGLITVQV